MYVLEDVLFQQTDLAGKLVGLLVVRHLSEADISTCRLNCGAATYIVHLMGHILEPGLAAFLPRNHTRQLGAYNGL